MGKRKRIHSFSTKRMVWTAKLLLRHRGSVSVLIREGWPLLEHANEFGYFYWPSQIEEYIRGKHVLDVGCGRSLHCVGFLFEGARSYTGLDPELNLDDPVLKDCGECRGGFPHIAMDPKAIDANPSGG
jgi:hypothetical protein